MRKFDKYAQEGNEFLSELSRKLGHSEEKDTAMVILKSTLHTIRDRITISESFNLMAQLPLVLKGVYVEHWNYHDKPPHQYDTFEEFKNNVKKEQELHGETEFDWPEHTEEIIKTTLECLKSQYFSQGQLDHIMENLPKDIAEHLQEV